MTKLALLVALCLCSPLRANAQEPADPISAQVLFDQAELLQRQGNWAEACPKFELSHKLEATPTLSYWLGRCHLQSGRTTSAWFAFKQALDALQTRPMSSDQRDGLQAEIAKVMPSIDEAPRLTIRAATVPRGLKITRNGVMVSVATIGTTLPVDPGRVQLHAEAPGFLSFDREVEATAGRHVEVALVLKPVPARRTPAREKPRPEQTATNRPQLLAGWALVGAGSAGGLAATTLGVIGWVQVGESNAECDSADICSARGVELRTRAEALVDAAWVTGLTGAALFVTGTALAITAPGNQRLRARLAPASVSIELALW